jgi:hypothetical protein
VSNKLLEIEAAAEALSAEEKEELFRFLTARLRSPENLTRTAKLVPGPKGTLLLEASPDAPPMTTVAIKQMLEDFP